MGLYLYLYLNLHAYPYSVLYMVWLVAHTLGGGKILAKGGSASPHWVEYKVSLSANMGLFYFSATRSAKYKKTTSYIRDSLWIDFINCSWWLTIGRGLKAQITNASLVVSLTLPKVIFLTIIVSAKKAFLNRTFCAAKINFWVLCQRRQRSRTLCQLVFLVIF